MPTDIVMPQMGESIVEGTITKWLKKPGDKIQRDEPLFEISTDKVDAEIPAPAAGILQEIKVTEGTTVQVNTVVGTIVADGEAAAVAAPKAAAEKKAPATPAPAPKAEAPTPPVSLAAQARHDVEDHARSSPLVRKIAREHNVSLSDVRGSGLGGRITKEDILAFVEAQEKGVEATEPALSDRPEGGSRMGVSPVQPGGDARPSTAGAPLLPGVGRSGDVSQPSPQTPSVRPTPAAIPGDLVSMTNMRKIIAQRMIESRRTSAHVHCMFEVDLTRIVNLRNKLKSGFEQRNGARLTFMPFFVRAAIIALQQFPIVNASLEGDSIRYHRHVNVGIAVALDWGLIVPVLKNADELNFLGLQRGITDLGERSRNKKLKPEEVEGSTFTITNPGQFGAVFGLPIINQPNAAILGVGGITKMPLVVTDADGSDSIAIRSVVHLTLGYDHRIIDGAVADQFMAFVKKTLEGWGEDVG
jgi:pyruvate dehydrogenase E2 component (dihydrolipoamide acetyltransferase)